jgi:hypothetical protein
MKKTTAKRPKPNPCTVIRNLKKEVRDLLAALEETTLKCRGYISCRKECEGYKYHYDSGCKHHYENGGFCRVPLWEALIERVAGRKPRRSEWE